MGQDQGLIALIISSKALSVGDQGVLVVCSHEPPMFCLPSHVVVTDSRVMPAATRIATSSPSALAQFSAALRASSWSL